MFFFEAFGGQSREFAEALVDGKAHNPLGRYEKADYNAAVACLRRHHLYKAFFGTDAEVAWKRS